MDNPATYYLARNHRPEPRSALDKFRRLYRLEPGEMNKKLPTTSGETPSLACSRHSRAGKERP